MAARSKDVPLSYRTRDFRARCKPAVSFEKWKCEMVERIASILPAKGSVLHFVSPDAPVYEAVVTMAARGIGAVLVIEQGSLVGIVSAKDYGTRVVLKGKNGKDVL